jgi:hypothetical protein
MTKYEHLFGESQAGYQLLEHHLRGNVAGTYYLGLETTS